jgi:hypothetical protein
MWGQPPRLSAERSSAGFGCDLFPVRALLPSIGELDLARPDSRCRLSPHKLFLQARLGVTF